MASIGALFACCPPVALLNLVVGAVAWTRVRASGGSKRGARLAIAAMVASLAIGTLAGVLAERVARASEATMVSQVRDGVTQLVQAEIDPSAWWLDSSPAALAQFQGELHARLGKPKVTTVTMTSTELGMPTRATFRFLLEQDGTTRVGSVECVLETDPSTWLPQVRFTTLRVDLESGAMAFPPPTAAPATEPEPK